MIVMILNYDVNDVGEGFRGCGGDMTMVLLDVMMLGVLVVVLISWISNMVNMIMSVVMLTVRHLRMLVC